MPREFQFPIRVYIEDTDAGGIVYYVNYLKFMERARTEFMRWLGFGKQNLIEQEIMFVVHSLQVDYRSPARLDDELQATARIIDQRRTYMVFEQKICLGDEVLAQGEVKVACVKKDSVRPAAIPGEMLAALKAYQGDTE